MTYKTEIEFGTDFVAFLRAQGFETWQEVVLDYTGLGAKTADIVAKKEGLYYLFELKLKLSDTLLEQVANRKRLFNYAYAVVPELPKRKISGYYEPHINRISEVKKYFIENMGIGLWLYDPEKAEDFDMFRLRRYHPTLKEHSCTQLEKFLNKEQQISKAGSKEGEKVTPFKTSVAKMIEYLEANPGASKMQMWDALDLHWANYKSMCSSLPKANGYEGVIRVFELLDGNK